MINGSRYLENNLKKIVDDTLQWNGFMAHPENILVGMLLDTCPSIRTLAVKRIQEAREKDTGRLLSFVPPRIQFDARDYVDMVNWEKTVVTPPSPTCRHQPRRAARNRSFRQGRQKGV